MNREDFLVTDDKEVIASRKALIEARKQEMESIRHGFYTVFMGKKIPSKEIKPFLGR